jgi:hypothetical protein
MNSDLLQFTGIGGPNPIEYLLGLLAAQIGLFGLVLE